MQNRSNWIFSPICLSLWVLFAVAISVGAFFILCEYWIRHDGHITLPTWLVKLCQRFA